MKSNLICVDLKNKIEKVMFQLLYDKAAIIWSRRQVKQDLEYFTITSCLMEFLGFDDI